MPAAPGPLPSRHAYRARMQNVVRVARWLALGSVALFAITLITRTRVDVAFMFMVIMVLVVTVVGVVDLVVRRR